MDQRLMAILYGSQTGTAQEVAERTWREAKSHQWLGPIVEMNQFSPLQLDSYKIVIFVCSTTGQGDEPDNMKQFWSFLLRKSLPPGLLKNLRVAVLGLGDSSYAKFNFAAKKLNKRLLQLGAEPLLDVGLADDQHDLGADAVIDPWLQKLWKEVNSLYPPAHTADPLDTFTDLQFPLFYPRYTLEIFHSAETTPPESQDWVSVDASMKAAGVTNATVLHTLRTTSENHYQDVRLVGLSIEDLVYKPGDVMMVQPKNLQQNVKTFLQLFNFEGCEYITISPGDKEYFIPLPPRWLLSYPMTITDCASSLLDLQAPPQRYTLQLMAHFTSSKLEKERLLEFCTPEGQQDLFDYCHRQRRTMLEVLQDFPAATASVPRQYLFDIFRLLKPRAFSIASACEKTHGQAELLVAVVNYKSRLQAPRLGLCSNWLANLTPGDHVSIWIRPGSFQFPQDPHIPVIMVAPGTGCAPFRNFIQHRALSCPQVTGKLFLFFGCRKEMGDFHCKEEWEGYVKSRVLTLVCAFSQDHPDKVYVQHKLAEYSKHVWKLLHDDGAYIFVAGNAKNMPNAVRSAFVDIVKEGGNLTREAAEQFIQELEKRKMYQSETWS